MARRGKPFSRSGRLGGRPRWGASVAGLAVGHRLTVAGKRGARHGAHFGHAAQIDSCSSDNDLYFDAEEVYANGSSQLEVVMSTTILSYYMLIGPRRNEGEWTYIRMVGIFV